MSSSLEQGRREGPNVAEQNIVKLPSEAEQVGGGLCVCAWGGEGKGGGCVWVSTGLWVVGLW